MRVPRVHAVVTCLKKKQTAGARWATALGTNLRCGERQRRAGGRERHARLRAMSSSCAADDGPRAVVTLSLGNRPFVQHTRPLMAAYARRVHADFHCVDSTSHESVKSAAIAKAKNAAATRFLKLPLLTHFLKLYARVLYLDDDVLIGPAMPDLFARVPCTHVGATVEKHKPQNWHTMHWRSACELYGIENCQARQWQLFNSGLMVLSRRAHGQVLATGWRDDDALRSMRTRTRDKGGGRGSHPTLGDRRLVARGGRYRLRQPRSAGQGPAVPQGVGVTQTAGLLR